MTAEEMFLELIRGYEGPSLDFKERHFERAERYEFVKDILAMANTPREGPAHILLGVRHKAETGVQLVGLDRQVDDTHYVDLLGTDNVHPLPALQYIPVSHGGGIFGILEIGIRPDGPYLPAKNLGEVLREAEWWVRRSSKNVLANSTEVRACITWFDALRRSRDFVPAPVGDGQAWDRFLEACEGFDRRRQYLLVVDSIPGADANLHGLGDAPWSFVIDFDPKSDSQGLLAAIQPRLRERRTVYLAVKGQRQPFNPRVSTVWFFARGLAGSAEPPHDKSVKEWRKDYGRELSAQLIEYAVALAPDPVTVVALWHDRALGKHLRSTLEKVSEALGDLARVVVATPDRAAAADVESDDLATTVIEIDARSVAAGLAHRFAQGAGAGQPEVVLPMRSGAPCTLSPRDRLWIEEDFEIIHQSAWEKGPDSPDEFRRGGTVSWRDLHLAHDCTRNVTPHMIKQVETDLGKFPQVRVNLFHRPGAGATTVARRLLWDLHERYPCLALRRPITPESAERIGQVYAVTQNSVLVLIDGSVYDDQLAEGLYRVLKAKQTPAVLLLVRRRFTKPATVPRTFWLPEELTPAEADRFAAAYSTAAPLRATALRALTRRSGAERSAFYFGLTAFGRDFAGLRSYVGTRLASLPEIQRPVATFLALAHHYTQHALPAQAFAGLLGFPAGDTLRLERILPAEFQELLVLTETAEWRMAHDLFAEQCLWQLLAPSAKDDKAWRQHLSDRAIQFIRFTRGNAQTVSERMLELVKDMFIIRDNAELLAADPSSRSSFVPIIEDIPLPIGQENVMRALTEAYPEEAHFHAHLGRFYGIRGQYDEARQALERALQLEQGDATLHHMRGMAIRYQVNDLIGRRAPLSDVLRVAQEASASFARSRELKPENEHGFISEVQLLTKVLEYAAKTTKRPVRELTSDPATAPYLREALDQAEDLLARVRLIRQGDRPSNYELDCRNRLSRLYGNHKEAIAGWYNLLQRAGVSKAPVRRQIVWAILDSYGGDWAKLRVVPKDMDRVLRALTENITESLKDDRSFRLWLRAQRAATNPFPLDQIIERVSYWRSNTDSLEAAFYLYVLYALKAFEGFPLARQDTQDAIDYCRYLARGNRARTLTIEWLGPGQGIHRLVHDEDLGDWVDDFREKKHLLVRLRGRIDQYENPQAGWIKLEQIGLSVFFVPAHRGFRREDVNRIVDFYLGFRYEGLKAWDVRPVIGSAERPSEAEPA